MSYREIIVLFKFVWAGSTNGTQASIITASLHHTHTFDWKLWQIYRKRAWNIKNVPILQNRTSRTRRRFASPAGYTAREVIRGRSIHARKSLWSFVLSSKDIKYFFYHIKIVLYSSVRSFLLCHGARVCDLLWDSHRVHEKMSHRQSVAHILPPSQHPKPFLSGIITSRLQIVEDPELKAHVSTTAETRLRLQKVNCE